MGARPIEIVEYQRHHIRCQCCGETTTPAWQNQMIPGQDLGIKLQGLLGWLGNYGHLPYEKQQELLWELREFERKKPNATELEKRHYSNPKSFCEKNFCLLPSALCLFSSQIFMTQIGLLYVEENLNPTLKERLHSAMKNGSDAFIEEVLNNPYIKVAARIIQGFAIPK